MSVRLNYPRVAPGVSRAMRVLQDHVNASGLEHPLLELVKLRASYINGCAYCVDMHTKDARAAGETEQRLYAVPVWHETPFFSPREQAALAWTEAVTSIAGTGVADAAFDAARARFTENELAELTLAVVAINGWNRFCIALGAEVGAYQPVARGSAAED